MGRVQGTQVGEIPQPGEPISSTPPAFQAAIITALLPCLTYGQIAEVLDEGNTTCPMGSFMYLLTMPVLCSQWILGSKYRAKLRRNYNLVEVPYTGVISHIFCMWCSLCQEFTELQRRGLDPALG